MWPERGLIVELVGGSPSTNSSLESAIKTSLMGAPSRTFGGRPPRITTSLERRDDTGMLLYLVNLALRRLVLSPSSYSNTLRQLRKSDQPHPGYSLGYLASLLCGVEASRQARKSQDIYLTDRGLLQHLWWVQRTGGATDEQWLQNLASMHFPIVDPDLVVCVPDSTVDGDVLEFVTAVVDGVDTEIPLISFEQSSNSVGAMADEVASVILGIWGGETVRANWVRCATLQGPYREKAWWA